jgi:hypothetical protein
MEKSNRFLRGLLLLVGGGLLTLITYNAASGGGSYFIFYGAMAAGAFDILVALFSKD